MRRTILFALPLLIALTAGASVGGAEIGTGGADCSAAPRGPSLVLVYRLQEEVAGARDEVVGIVCERLGALGVSGQVTALGEREVRAVLPPLGDARSERVLDQIGARNQVLFYDWEPNLIGPQLRIGGFPGYQPPNGALRRAEREWRAAGRNPDRRLNRQLILDGAFPTVYRAVRLASEREPRRSCRSCSARGPLFYLFDRTPRHRLLAGPVVDRNELRAADARRPGSGVILRVPVGTAIAAEHPIDATGEVKRTAAPGWYALRDRPVLSGADIVDPAQGLDQYNTPNVTFGFTPRGRTAFQRLTRAIAQRGQVQALGPVTAEQAEALSGHFAIVLDGLVLSRPIVNFAENPDGIDGRTGAQISGGFGSVREARDLALSLGIGALPVGLELVRLERR